MSFKEHRKIFNKRWDISSSESYEQAFQKFQRRILNIFEDIRNYSLTGIDQVITAEGALDFRQYYGIQEKFHVMQKITIIDRLRNEKNEKEFYRLIEVIFLCFDNPYSIKRHMLKKIKEAVEMSEVNAAMREDSQGNIMFYPKGEKTLDEALVNKPLSFLDEKSNRHFEEALRLYQSKKHVKSAESLRRALEEFFRHKRQNTKGLAKNIKKLPEENQKGDESELPGNIQDQEKTLKKGGASLEIRNIMRQTFHYLDQYFNEHSKHKDGNITEAENEFLIYQTGLLLRYINKFQGDKK